MVDTEAHPAEQKRLGARAVSAFAIIGAGLMFGFYMIVTPWFFRGPPRLSEEVTVFTGPLRPDGTVDYCAAFDAIFSEGVTPENNAVTVLVEAFGPGVISEARRDEVLEELGLGHLIGAGNTPLPDMMSFLRSHAASSLTSREQRHRLRDVIADTTATKLEDKLLQQPWSRDEYPEVGKFLDGCADLLERVIEASHRSRWYFPLLPAEGQSLHNTQATVNLCMVRHMLACRIMMRIGGGDVDGALDDISTRMRLASLQVQNEGFMFLLHTMALHGNALTGLRAVLQHHPIAADEVAAALASGLELEREDFMRAVRRFDKASCLDMVNTKVNMRELMVDPNIVYARIDYWWNKKMAALSIDGFVRARDALQSLNAELERCTELKVSTALSLVLHHRRARFLGDYAGHAACLALVDAHTRLFRIIASHRTIAVAAAAQSFRNREGRWPETGELFGLFDATPLDPFDGQPLRYVREEGGVVIYSIGDNLTDNGGKVEADLRFEDGDIGVRLRDN